MTIEQAERLIKLYESIEAKLNTVTDRVEGLYEKVGEFAEQIEETVVRIEDAARDASSRDDYQ